MTEKIVIILHLLFRVKLFLKVYHLCIYGESQMGMGYIHLNL